MSLTPSTAKLPQFEVATIKPASVNYIDVYVKPGGRVLAGNCSVLCLVREAFNTPEFRISGGPDWVKSMFFDISAVPPDDSPARQCMPAAMNSPTTDEQRLLFQALLRDRFGFRYHVEQREQPVLCLRRNGKPLKLNPPKDPMPGGQVSAMRVTRPGGMQDHSTAADYWGESAPAECIADFAQSIEAR